MANYNNNHSPWKNKKLAPRPIVFKKKSKADPGPSSDDIKAATDAFLKKGGEIKVDYYQLNPELVDEDTFVSSDEELNQILEEAKI